MGIANFLHGVDPEIAHQRDRERDKTEMPGGDPWVLPTTLYDEIGNNERRGRGNWDQKFGASWVQQPPDQNMSFMSLFSDMPDHVIRQQKEHMSRQTRADFGIAPPPPPQPPTLPLPRTARRVISATGKVGYTTRSDTRLSVRAFRVPQSTCSRYSLGDATPE